MNKLIKLGLVAAFVVGGAGSVLAEDAAATAAGAADKSAAATAGTIVDATQTGSIGTNLGSLVTSINAGASVDLNAITDASTVNFVTVSSFTDADKSSLDAAITSKTEALASLRGSVGANASLKAKLEAAGYSIDDVLAVETGADGAVTVYVDDRA